MNFIRNKITTYSLYILKPRVTILNFDLGVLYGSNSLLQPWQNLEKKESKGFHQCVKLFFMEKSLRFVQDR